MNRGVQPGWESIAVRVRAKTDRRLSLDPVPDGLTNGPREVEVRLDDELLGDFVCEWPESQPADETLAGLREQIAWFLDELFQMAGTQASAGTPGEPSFGQRNSWIRTFHVQPEQPTSTL